MGISIDEKRVYDASEGPTPVYVVGEFGVARVDTSDDLVGEFGLAHRCTARDAAGRDGHLAVATDEDVLVGVFGDEPDEDDDASETEFRALGVGPAVAVGFADGGAGGGLVAAREDGTVVREGIPRESASDDAPDWTELDELDDVRAIDGGLVAAASGVYRVEDDSLRHVGLESVRGVSATGVPLAATDDGLYELGNGWLDALDGEFRAVSASDADASVSAGTLGRAHAAGADGLFAHEDDEWRAVELPVSGEVVALDQGEGTYAVTAEGTFLLSVGDGWTHQILGLRGVEAVAAP
ncbi:HVO_0234 family beta-propeller protein [Halorussus pelagicus]|uniref:HVO_0234 family beta-propeller protein n=1 Tax=Halorussus pelagicus TaxID=2505977 RepID=UPI000FFC68F6|nr:hypothetical protein [Halorussus pelagicus]